MYIKDYRKNFYTKEGKRINIKGYVYDNKSDKVIVLYKYNGFDTSKEIENKTKLINCKFINSIP